MWDLPGPGLEPVSPALAGGFFTTVPPGKSQGFDILTELFVMGREEWFSVEAGRLDAVVQGPERDICLLTFNCFFLLIMCTTQTLYRFMFDLCHS